MSKEIGAPAHAELKIESTHRLTPDRLGTSLEVTILDARKAAVPGVRFRVHSTAGEIMSGETDTNGQFRGRRLLMIREGTQEDIFLVLEGSAVSDWKQVPPERELTAEEIAKKEKVRQEEEEKTRESQRREVEEKERQSLEEQLQKEEEERRKHARRIEEYTSGVKSILGGEELILNEKICEVKGIIVIEEGGRLVVKEGSTLNFDENAGILCRGTLVVEGSAMAPVVFQALGRFWRNITISGRGVRGVNLKYLTVRGGRGSPNMSVLNAGPPKNSTSEMPVEVGNGGGLLINAVKDNEVNLENVEIRDSRGLNGGGVYIEKCAPKFKNVKIHSNEAENNGGGVFLMEAKPLVEDSEVSGNSAKLGGGFYVSRSMPGVYRCRIIRNQATGIGGGSHGGGFFVSDNSHLVIDDGGEVDGNLAAHSGGGLFVSNAKAEIRDTTIRSNRGLYGGGIYGWNASVNLETCSISGNTADFNGGGLGLSSATIGMNNVTISGNSANGSGGGIFADRTIFQDARRYNKICGNNAGRGAGGVGGDGGFISSEQLTAISMGMFTINYNYPTNVNKWMDKEIEKAMRKRR